VALDSFAPEQALTFPDHLYPGKGATVLAERPTR